MTVPLFGRQNALQEMDQFLSESGRHHVSVAGVPGIGKSAFVQEILRKQIAEDILSHLIWIQCPPTVTFIRHLLVERLLPEESHISLSECLLVHRVGIVLDSIEKLEDDLEALDVLLDELSGAIVFITTHTSQMLRNITRYVVLEELDEFDSACLTRSFLGPSLSNEMVLYQQVGGNPLALKLAAQNIDSRVNSDDFYAQTLSELDQQLLETLCQFVLFPGAVSTLGIQQVWHDVTDEQHIRSLVEHHLIEDVSQDQSLYSPPSSARKYIELHYC
jgi:hypothetical protein